MTQKELASMHPKATVVARFWAKVDVRSADDCWPWVAGLDGKGYGAIKIEGRQYLAHRYAFFLAYGTWPHICRHRCDTPSCCNPTHLLDGTYQDNTLDAVDRGRWPRARLTAADVVVIRALVASGMTRTAVAARYGIGDEAVSRIVNRKRWGHVP